MLCEKVLQSAYQHIQTSFIFVILLHPVIYLSIQILNNVLFSGFMGVYSPFYFDCPFSFLTLCLVTGYVNMRLPCNHYQDLSRCEIRAPVKP